MWKEGATKQLKLVLCAALWVLMIGSGINLPAMASEDRALADDEDVSGEADCDDPACAAARESFTRIKCGNGITTRAKPATTAT